MGKVKKRKKQKKKGERLLPPEPMSPTHPIERETSVEVRRSWWSAHPLQASLVALFLSAQVGLPLSYYLGDYPWDERFSWRMFSTVRSLSCEVSAWREGAEGRRAVPCPRGEGVCEPINLSQELHMVWVNLLKRGRREVLKAFVKRQCERAPSRPLYVRFSCPHPDAPHPLVTLQAPDVDLCAHPEALLGEGSFNNSLSRGVSP